MVTHPSTNLPICSLCKAERTGYPVFYSLWSYVLCCAVIIIYIGKVLGSLVDLGGMEGNLAWGFNFSADPREGEANLPA